MTKTIEEINAKIRSGTAVVFTAEEIIDVVKDVGVKKAAREVDVVTTGTFSPMCSSGAFLNIKQPKEKMKLGGGFATLNGVPAYAGLAAADIYVGATAIPDGDLDPGQALTEIEPAVAVVIVEDHPGDESVRIFAIGGVEGPDGLAGMHPDSDLEMSAEPLLAHDVHHVRR